VNAEFSSAVTWVYVGDPYQPRARTCRRADEGGHRRQVARTVGGAMAKKREPLNNKRSQVQRITAQIREAERYLAELQAQIAQHHHQANVTGTNVNA
jgi:hypothetical protein